VLCNQVLVEHCQARGACDAGIYVGQSRNIIVRYCEVEKNVTGINLENCSQADVYGNLAMNNACGILLINVPTVMVDNGSKVRVFKNQVLNNNHHNFAPKGALVAGVPSGSGVVVVATSQTEVFENEVIDNYTMGTGVFYYALIEPQKYAYANEYKSYPSEVSIYRNRYSRSSGGKPQFHGKFAKLHFTTGQVPHILYGGDIAQAKATKKRLLCMRQNQVLDKSPLFANIDAPNGFKHIRKNDKAYDCSLPKLPKTWVTGN
jgi:parallel beta-helix repeat protein